MKKSNVKDETAPRYDGTRTAMCATDLELVAKAKDVIRAHFAKGPELTSPQHTRDCLQVLLADSPHEIFGVLMLDNRNRVIEFREMFRGTIDGASVYPREVVKAVLNCNASAVILTHNHPSGVCEPSQADIRITDILKKALATIDVRILDHVIVGADSVSLAERGLV